MFEINWHVDLRYWLDVIHWTGVDCLRLRSIDGQRKLPLAEVYKNRLTNQDQSGISRSGDSYFRFALLIISSLPYRFHNNDGPVSCLYR